MKITDFSILFLVIMLSLCTIYEFKDQMTFNKSISDEEINKIVDNSVVKALDCGYVDDIGDEKIIDLDTVWIVLKNTISNLLYGNISEYYTSKVNDNIVACILIEKNGYYTLIDEKWSDKNIFSSSSHNGKVQEIEDVLEEKMDNYIYRILLPKNSGEIFAQTVSDYSILLVYKTQEFEYDKVRYSGCILSGAAIK